MSDAYTNKDVVERLDKLIAIMKLAYKDQLDTQKEIISKDKVSKTILELLNEDSMDYSTLVEKTAIKAITSHRTVKRRIADLSDSKILSKRRESGKTVYFNSGILE